MFHSTIDLCYHSFSDHLYVKWIGPNSMLCLKGNFVCVQFVHTFNAWIIRDFPVDFLPGYTRKLGSIISPVIFADGRFSSKMSAETDFVRKWQTHIPNSTKIDSQQNNLLVYRAFFAGSYITRSFWVQFFVPGRVVYTRQ